MQCSFIQIQRHTATRAPPKNPFPTLLLDTFGLTYIYDGVKLDVPAKYDKVGLTIRDDNSTFFGTYFEVLDGLLENSRLNHRVRIRRSQPGRTGYALSNGLLSGV